MQPGVQWASAAPGVSLGGLMAANRAVWLEPPLQGQGRKVRGGGHLCASHQEGVTVPRKGWHWLARPRAQEEALSSGEEAGTRKKQPGRERSLFLLPSFPDLSPSSSRGSVQEKRQTGPERDSLDVSLGTFRAGKGARETILLLSGDLTMTWGGLDRAWARVQFSVDFLGLGCCAVTVLLERTTVTCHIC